MLLFSDTAFPFTHEYQSPVSSLLTRVEEAFTIKGWKRNWGNHFPRTNGTSHSFPQRDSTAPILANHNEQNGEEGRSRCRTLESSSSTSDICNRGHGLDFQTFWALAAPVDFYSPHECSARQVRPQGFRIQILPAWIAGLFRWCEEG